MATSAPPRSPRTPPPPPRAGRRRAGGPTTARPRRLGLLLGIAAGLVALALLLYLLMGGTPRTEYRMIFETAELLVRGNQVQVGGVPVGKVKNIILTPNYRAEVIVEIESPPAPLHLGTTAEIKYASLSGVANRYIAVNPGPNNFPKLPAGGTIPVTHTKSPVGLDEVLNALNPPTRRGLQQVLKGWGEQYAGVEPQVNVTTHYLAPSLRSISHVFAELTRDERTFTEFLVNAAKATTVIGARSENLRSLIGNADTTFQAIGSQQEALARGLRLLPITFTQGTKTFTELIPTLGALTELVNVSKPNTKTLPLLLERLRPLLAAATPVVENLGVAISRPGLHNDFTDAALELPQLAKTLESASPNTVRAERESIPNTAFFGPYSPDLQGLFRNFGQASAYYDANGHYLHTALSFNSFRLGSNNTLTPVTPQQGLEGLTTGQLRRCPGAATAPAADGSSPFTDGGLLGCIASQVP
jgi:phospholipid/cholesterol/gamma-HCH transport system substrate-binding protein